MYGLMAELCKVDMRNDPRLLETWSSQVKMWEIGHPLGIKGLAYVTLGVKDLDAASQTYVERIGAIPVASGVDDAGQFRYQLVQLGDSLLQLAQPLDEESPLGQHVARWGNMIYGITFSVRDLDSAQAWLDKKSIRTTRPRPGLLAANPDDCFGAPYFFTTDTLAEVP
jgi:4-hydroxyphenylpyruvate dioxygenase-like putative hemolysin